jgi:hypothetical protein
MIAVGIGMSGMVTWMEKSQLTTATAMTAIPKLIMAGVPLLDF